MSVIRYMLAAMLLLFVGCTPVSAQTSVPATVTVDPARLEFSLSSDAPSASSIVVITNQRDYAVDVSAQFRAIDESGGRIVPAGEIEPALSETLKLSETEFTIAPNSKYYVTVNATDNSQLSAGGHYATLVLSDTPPDGEEGGISSQVSLGVFVVKAQGAVQAINLTKSEFTRGRFAFPTRATVEFYNDGNVHITPRGYIRIYDTEQVYYETILNTSSTTILPAQRVLEQRDVRVRPSGWLPRKITIELGYRADGINETKFYREEFWYVAPYSLPLPIALICIGIGYFMLKRKKNRVTKKSAQNEV